MPTPFYLPFDAMHNYPEHSDGIVVPVSLLSGARFQRTKAAVDPGASVCLFSREVGEMLKLDIERGLYQRLGTLTGGLDAFGHEVGLETLGIAFDSMVYFARDYGLPRNLLGRRGWLNKLRFGLIEYEQLIYLSKYEG